jgi:hypothetical protein
MTMKNDIKAECTECGGRMVAGQMVDQRYYNAGSGEWVAGVVEVGKWTGEVKNAERYTVAAYRCDDCGFLKLYAREVTPERGWMKP